MNSQKQNHSSNHSSSSINYQTTEVLLMGIQADVDPCFGNSYISSMRATPSNSYMNRDLPILAIPKA